LERKEDLNRNFAKIVDYALKNKPDLFLVSADVFDKILPTNILYNSGEEEEENSST